VAEIRVITSPAAAEAVGAMLWDLGIAGVVEDRHPPTGVRLRCYLAPPRARPALRALRAGLRDLAGYGLDPGPAAVSSRLLSPRRWVRAFRRSARPVRIGRLVVAPTWVRVPRSPRRIILRIDPGMAFGSGAHPSTRLCLRALVRYVRPHPPGPPGRGPAVVDVGTGSGILAIAAARLGARRVRAREVDPVAVAVARQNIHANGVGHLVRVTRGPGLGPSPRRSDLIVANLTADAIIALLPSAAARLAPGGVFVGSGIVEDRLGDVLEAGAASGLARVGILASGAWRAVILAHLARRRFPPGHPRPLSRGSAKASRHLARRRPAITKA